MTDLVVRNLTAAQLADLQSQLCGATGPTGPTAPTGPTGPTIQPPAGSIPLTITLDGVPRDTTGMNPTRLLAVGTFVVPSGLTGKMSIFQCYEHGSASITRTYYISQDPNVMRMERGYYGNGTGGGNLYMAFDTPQFRMATVKAGETWYLCVKNTELDGSPTCGASLNCNFGYNATPPT